VFSSQSVKSEYLQALVGARKEALKDHQLWLCQIKTLLRSALYILTSTLIATPILCFWLALAFMHSFSVPHDMLMSLMTVPILTSFILAFVGSYLFFATRTKNHFKEYIFSKTDALKNLSADELAAKKRDQFQVIVR